MVEMTNDEVNKGAGRNAAGCLVASLCAVLLLTCVLGWLVYLACAHWPLLARALPPVGFVSLGVAVHMLWEACRWVGR